jgi:hypothetical protein
VLPPEFVSVTVPETRSAAASAGLKLVVSTRDLKHSGRPGWAPPQRLIFGRCA